MKIAMMTNNYKPFIGGVPISIERLSKSLRNMGHEVTIFAPTYENQIEEPGVVRYRSFKRTMKNNVVIPYIIDSIIEKKFKELDIDVIHVHHPNFIGWTALFLGKKYNIPVIYTYHTRYEEYLHHLSGLEKINKLTISNQKDMKQRVAKKVMAFIKEYVVLNGVRQFANQCNYVIAPTHLMKGVLEDMGITRPVKILPTGIQENFFTYEQSSSEKIRQQYKKSKKYLFCTVSRLDEEKNIPFLIHGLSTLKQKLGDTFNMLIIGDGSKREELEQTVSKLGLEDLVTFLGNIPNHEIKNYYAACDLFLFASKSETQGIVLLEAMASKLPVVAVKASGVIEIVKNGINGYMTDECTDNWVEGILCALKEQSHFEKLKEGAYQTALDYTCEKIGQKAFAIYQEALNDLEKYHKVGYYDEVYTR